MEVPQLITANSNGICAADKQARAHTREHNAQTLERYFFSPRCPQKIFWQTHIFHTNICFHNATIKLSSVKIFVCLQSLFSFHSIAEIRIIFPTLLTNFIEILSRHDRHDSHDRRRVGDKDLKCSAVNVIVSS